MTRSVLFLFLVFSIAAAAQQAAPAKKPAAPAKPATAQADEPASRDEVLHLLDLMQFEKQMDEVHGMMEERLRPLLQRSISDEMKTAATPEQRLKFQQLIPEINTALTGAYPSYEMVGDAIPVYQKYLTHSDVKALTAFYSSPVGQKLVNLQPDIMSDVMAVVVPKMEERTKSAVQKMQQRIADVKKQGPSRPAGQGAKPAPSPRASAPANSPSSQPFTPAAPAQK